MNIALILSGGTGTRMGTDIPKQYIEVCGKPIISYCFDTLSRHRMIDKIHIAAAEKWQNFITKNCISNKFTFFSEPGVNRQLSIYNALADILKYSDKDDYILIHDAARPLLTEKLITECLTAAFTHDGAIPVLSMKDTVYMSENGKTISSLISREKIFAGQAPEAFLLGKYYNANRALFPEKILEINGSTEPAIMYGMDIAMISGDENNFKITTRQDMKRFESIRRHESESMGSTWN